MTNVARNILPVKKYLDNFLSMEGNFKSDLEKRFFDVVDVFMKAGKYKDLKDLGAKISVGAQNFYDIRKGKQPLSLSLLLTFVKNFPGTNHDYILFGNGAPLLPGFAAEDASDYEKQETLVERLKKEVAMERRLREIADQKFALERDEWRIKYEREVEKNKGYRGSNQQS